MNLLLIRIQLMFEQSVAILQLIVIFCIYSLITTKHQRISSPLHSTEKYNYLNVTYFTEYDLGTNPPTYTIFVIHDVNF